MPRSRKDRRFKPYAQNQLMALPPSFDELIAVDHPVRIVSQIVDKINLDPILEKYSGGGASSYHPRMLLKVWVYAYMVNTLSSRKVEEAITSNIHYMWLAGMQRPDHNTLARFRSGQLKDTFYNVFKQVVILLYEAGYLDLKQAYLDGTKLEANANRYTFVWGRAIQTNIKRIEKQLQELWQYAEQTAKEELERLEPDHFQQIDAQKVVDTIEKIDQALAGKPVDKKVKQKLNRVKKDWPNNLAKYEEQKKILGGRNSYSKTDPDATFMRMKEDHMKNGQLKPGYNWQISTSNQFVTHYSIHPNPTDTKTLQPHFASFQKHYGQLPKILIADSGYGSQQNYQWCEEHQIDDYVKYNYFHKELSGSKYKKYPFHQDVLHYNAEQDQYTCPSGQPMRKTGIKKDTTERGYAKELHQYQAQNCQGCPMRGPCHKGKGNRKIEVNHVLNEMKRKAREKLTSEQGVYHRGQRPVQVEAVFGNIKQNYGFRRLNLRGNQKVEIEAGLAALAHNLRKLAKLSR